MTSSPEFPSPAQEVITSVFVAYPLLCLVACHILESLNKILCCFCSTTHWAKYRDACNVMSSWSKTQNTESHFVPNKLPSCSKAKMTLPWFSHLKLSLQGKRLYEISILRISSPMTLRPRTLPALLPFSGSCISDRVKATDSWVQWLESPVSRKWMLSNIPYLLIFVFWAPSHLTCHCILVVIMLIVLKLTFKV